MLGMSTRRREHALELARSGPPIKVSPLSSNPACSNVYNRFIHTLFLSNDANFRLKNRLRPNARPDGPLGPGLGCIVEPKKYLDHVKKSVSESDVSTLSITLL